MYTQHFDVLIYSRVWRGRERARRVHFFSSDSGSVSVPVGASFETDAFEADAFEADAFDPDTLDDIFCTST